MKKLSLKSKRPRGRPTKYQDSFPELVRRVAELGATDFEIAHVLGVDCRTLQRWSLEHDDLCRALKLGKEAADERVQRSLYHRAVGYSYNAVKIMSNGAQVPYVEHVPPDTTAAIFWLKNRRRTEWRDRHELSGPDGGPLQIEIVRFADSDPA